MLISLSPPTASHRKPIRNAFSLLELLICVSIILVLATVAVPKFTAAGKNAKIAKIQTDIRTISNAVALYNAENGVNPTKIDDLITGDAHGNKYLQFKPQTPDKGEYGYVQETGLVSATYDKVTYDSNMGQSATKTEQNP